MARGRKEKDRPKTGEPQQQDLKLHLQDVPAENVFSNAKIAHLLEKYGKAKTYIPPEKKRQFRSEGFCIRFRLSKAYRGLEKQEVITSRPEIERITGRRKKQKMAKLMRQLEAEMMLPDPNAVAKEKFLEFQRLKMQRRREEQKEEKAEAEMMKKKAVAESQAVATALKSSDPRRSQYMMEYWGKPSKKKMTEKGDWRLKDKYPPSAGWWHKFVLKKPKITMASRRSSTISVRSKVTPMKVIDVQKKKKVTEEPRRAENKEENAGYLMDSTDFFIANIDNTPYSAVEEWERRNTERKLNRLERAHNLKMSNEIRNATIKKQKTFPVTIEEATESVLKEDGDKLLNTITEELEETHEDNYPGDRGNVLLNVDKRASISSVVSHYSYAGELGLSPKSTSSSSSGSSGSGSECSNGDIEQFLENNTAVAKDAKLKDNLKMLLNAKAMGAGESKTGSVKSVASHTPKSQSFRESSAPPSLHGQAEGVENGNAGAVKVTFNGDKKQTASTSSEVSSENPPKKSSKLARTKSAPATSKPSKDIDHLDDLGRPLKTYRCLYTMCNCRHVGRKNTLVKMQQKRRKEVGVITIFGCPPYEQQQVSSSVCPFCNVFPRKRIQAWLTDVENAK